MLIARGLAAGESPGALDARPRREIVAAVHRAYVEAGSDAVHTNSFGAHPLRLAAAGSPAAPPRWSTAAVALARAAGARYVIGDVGPTGEYLPPVGQGDAGELPPRLRRDRPGLRREPASTRSTSRR